MRVLALAAVCALSACATYAANASDPVDMAAELGKRGAQYVGMAGACDEAVGGGYVDAMAVTVAAQQDRLGSLRGLVDRAYRGRPTEQLRSHMQMEMAEHSRTAAQFCDAVLAQARADLSSRADYILSLGNGPLTMAQARDRGWIE